MDTCSAAREISLDNLHISTRASRIGNKHAMVPTRQGVLTAAAAESATAAAVDASAAATADAAWGAVKPTAVDDTDDAALGAVKTTAADDAEDSALGAVELTAAVDDDGLCRRTCCGHHHHDLRELPRPWPLPRGFTTVARVWVPPALQLLVLEPSICGKASPSSSNLISAIIKNFLFSASKSEGRPFRIRRLLSCTNVVTPCCSSFSTKALALVT